MFDAEVRFAARNHSNIEPLVEAVRAYACALRTNGQIADDFSISRNGRRIHLLCIVPEECALTARFHDRSSAVALERANRLCPQPAKAVITGEALDTPPACTCRRRPSLHLFTNLLDVSSPVACGRCRRAIPLYRLRELDLSLRERVQSWKRTYQACDELWMNGGVGEDWSYRQLADCKSSLSREGRALCADVEEATKCPAFYYLMCYRGRSAAEGRRRKCPACGGKWLLPSSEGCFDFRCEPCRLLSNVGP